ncbi:hybrid sensor histidine kinase/response regulator transcription factor [Negadavirga shengliensis]|uniref:histidine kinase n=1 Tax=Negadavirga shengliensis TaxID=1389218 RepID=A0ABV9SWM1_9BACT
MRKPCAHLFSWSLFLFVVISAFPLSAQESNAFLKFTHYTTKEGLPQNSVLAVCQDQLGYLWFGTDDGLARFDGYQFRIFRHDPTLPHSINNNVIRGMVLDKFHRIWIGTEGGGINIFDPYTEAFTPFEQVHEDKAGIYSKKISSLCKDDQDNIWVGTNGAGIYRISGFESMTTPGTVDSYFERLHIQAFQRHNTILEDDKIWSVYKDKSSNIWIGTLEGGAYRILNGTGQLEHVGLEYEGRAVHSVKSFYEDTKGNFWIGTEKYGVLLKKKYGSGFSPFALPETKMSFQQPDFNITGFKEDQHGDLWIGTLGRGLFVYHTESGHITHYGDKASDPYSLNGNSVYTVFEDRSGNMWLGMYSGEGLNKTNPGYQHFEHYRYDPDFQKGLSGKMVKSIIKDQTGNLWVGLFNGGLNLQPAGKDHFNYYTAGDGELLSHNHVQVVFQASDQKIWIGTDGGGINVYDPLTGRYHYHRHNPSQPNTLSKDEVWAFAQDEEGYIWIGTANGGGLNRFDPATGDFTQFHHDPNDANSLSFNDVRALHIDSKNNLWIGTYGGGLSKLDLENGKFHHFKHDAHHPNSISHDIITSVIEDKSGYIWIGTFGGGLNRLNPLDGGIKVYREKDGLPSDVVKAILEDDSGQLWISTVNGLSSLEKNSHTFRNYSQENGLQSDEFNLGAAFKDKEGKLYFGGTNGFNAFFPEKIKPAAIPNTPVITRLRVLNQETVPGKPISNKQIISQNISFTDEIKLHPIHNSVELEFSALEYTGQSKLQYAYQLENYDKDWIVTDAKRRYAPYSNLRPGNYIFKLKSFYENTREESGIARLQLTVLPPWYQSTWAYMAYILLFGLASYGIKLLVSWRMKLRNDLKIERIEKQKQEEINQLKMRFFTNISHELRTPLMLIKAPLEQLSKRDDLPLDVPHQLKSIHVNTARLLRLINQLLDFRKQETGHLRLTVREVEIVPFLKNIYQAFEVVASQRNIDFRLEFEDDIYPIMWFDPEQMEKVFYNLIYNAFKFTPDGGRIRIKVCRGTLIENGEQLEGLAISIEDTGKGILPEHRDLIFDRFFQISQGSDYPHVGTGIGLALSKNLVDFHKGKIEVHSTPGVETVFTVTLRNGFEHYAKHELARPDQTVRHSAGNKAMGRSAAEETFPAKELAGYKTINRTPPANRRVLIVEDNPELLRLLEKVLSEQFQVITASDGKQGLELCENQQPDLIISDVMMPVMDGIELCGRIKQNIATSHIPVILLTAKSSHIHQLEGYESGADDYVTKPFSLDLLTLKIKNLLESREKLRQQFKKSPNLEPSAIRVAPADETWLQTAIGVVEKNMDNPQFNINHLVKELGLSRTLVFEKFKALIGSTPNEFIQMIRLKRAAQLLLESDYKISEIGYMTGFNNPKYFSKCFHKQFGSNPSRYRLSESQSGIQPNKFHR